MTDRTHITHRGWALATLFAMALGLALGILANAAPALAGDVGYNEIRELRQSGEIRPLSELLERAQAERKGELLEAELEEREGELVYEIELLAEDGAVWELYFDARTGELLEIERED